MVTFKNNNRRSNFRRNERNYKSNSLDKNKFNSQFSSNENFQRKPGTRNNQNAYKLFEKYNNLAREMLSAGDKIQSENYFQHADHFKRILNENDALKREKSKSPEGQNPDEQNKVVHMNSVENSLDEGTEIKKN